ncbi:MAG: phosphotransferase, partial [Rhodanobacteraceae bacterium]
VATLRAQLPQRPGLADYLRGRDWEAELAQHVLPYQRQIQARLAEQKRLWTHNDWHVSNLAWSDRSAQATVSAVFDFGLASPTCALFDLATAIERNAIAWLELDRHCDIAHPEIALALLAGYQKLALLSRDQRAIVADLLPVVHVDFALSEVEYFHAVTGSARNADIAWNTFLLGHARWFDSADARALQAAIADT